MNNFCLYPPPVLRCFWKDPLMTPPPPTTPLQAPFSATPLPIHHPSPSITPPPLKILIMYRASTGRCDTFCLIITENLSLRKLCYKHKMYLWSWRTNSQNFKTMDRPPLRYRALKRTKESVTVSIATISGRRNFADIFSRLERLLAENLAKIRFLVLEL